MTYKQAVKIEPALKSLELAIRQEKDDGSKKAYCANGIWYPKYKPTMVELVGNYASKEKLRNSDAYNVVYKHLYNLLPDCRNCWCYNPDWY